MNDTADEASFQGDAPAAAQPSALVDRRELALVAVERTRMPMVVSDARQDDCPIVLANEAFLSLTGYSAEEVIGRNCRFLQGPGTDEADVEAIRAGLAEGADLFEVEILNYRKDGTAFWNELAISPVRNESGELLYYFASQKDITSRRRAGQLEAAEHQLLMEVDHRAMNALALVQSFVTLTKADTAAGFAAAVRGRVGALAKAHRLLAAAGWSGADMGELLDIELPASARERLITVGDAVRLPPSLVQPIALVLHELLTNAVEHGALASSRGSIRLEWRKQDGDLLLHWQEEGLEELAEPGQRGVGLRMLDSLMRKQLHGSVDMRWSPPGLDLRMVLPIAVEDAAPSELDPVA